MDIPSKKQWDEERPSFTPIPPDDYLLEVLEVKEEQQLEYQNPSKVEDVVNVSFKILSTRDGEEAKDEEGGSLENRKLFFTGRKKSIGFMTDGTPAKTRQLICYAMGANIEEGITIDSFDELVGKQIYGEVVKKRNQKGEEKNRIVRFMPVKKQKAEEEVNTEDIPF